VCLRLVTSRQVVTSRLDTLGQHGVDGLSSAESLVHLDELGDGVNHKLYQLSLRLAETSQVGDIVGGVLRQRRFTTGSALTQLEGGQDVVKTLVLLEVDETQMYGAAHHGTQVGGAGADVAQALVVHEVVALALHQFLNLIDSTSEATEDGLHVSTLLHRDDTDVVLLVHPHQEVLVVVVPDATTLGPVTGAARGRQEGAGGLLEQEVVINQLLHGLIVHGGQSVVLAGKVVGQAAEGIRHDVLDRGTFGT